VLEPLFAHLGHLYVSGPLFGGPVVLLAIAIKVAGWRERRRVASGAAPTESRVTATRDGDRTVIAIAGPFDYPAVLDIEAELRSASEQGTSAALLDLRRITEVDEQSAAELPQLVDAVWPAVTVSASRAPVELHAALERAHALEGIELVNDGGP
jgi:hypothetical protein